MIDANEVFQEMCQKYEAAVNANDSKAYSQLFAPDAIRIPPGSELLSHRNSSTRKKLDGMYEKY